MTDRRFTDKPAVDPSAVRSLPKGHPALLENRTLFPTTVVTVNSGFSDRLLVSGKNNRKLGDRIDKGSFKGYALYGLSLEERATCPASCSARDYCYGNGMQMARRHRIEDMDVFAAVLEREIKSILSEQQEGLMVRLHVLGDFPSAEYVAMWADLLDEHPRLACYGYTHRLPSGAGGDEIGDAIESVKSRHKETFRIRWSYTSPLPDGAVIVDYIPETKIISGGVASAVVCPAQTDTTACCASCGFCWEATARGKAVAFIKHGPKSMDVAAQAATAKIAIATGEARATTVTAENVRAVTGIAVPQKRDAVMSRVPEMRMVKPSDLQVEPAYQRDISGKSIKLIRKIVASWDWAKFKPPVCAETESGLFIIDGQHTAIAAASHPEITLVPVMVVAASRVERRAESFVSHNRDRLTMSAFQIFHAEVAAGVPEARSILAIAEAAGASIPRSAPLKGQAKQGQIVALSEARKIHNADGAPALARLLRIAVGARQAPIGRAAIRSLRIVCKERVFAETARLPDSHIANALRSIGNIDAAARAFAQESGQGIDRAGAVLIANACKIEVAAA